jgi:hypothetical protein
MKLIIQLVLWVIIAILGYLLFNSVYEPVKFNQIRNERYAKVIENLKDIRSAQLAHLEITGKFTGNFDSLVRFVDTAEFATTQRRDTVFADVERNKAYGIEDGYYLEAVIIDTLGFVSVKDSIFKGSDRYKKMMEIPIKGVDEKIELRAGVIIKNDRPMRVFEARVAKDYVLHDQSRDLVIQEKQTVSVDGVNGTHIIVGSMTDVNTNGNWPKMYDKREE